MSYQPLDAETPVRWGILATGDIAHQFTEDLQLMPDHAVVTGVGSRKLETAQQFADDYSVPHAYGSYEELAAADDVDVIYVSTPHSHHRDAIETCLKAGKHVLSEKPLTDTPENTRAVIDLARERGLFLMEGFWTACNPLVRRMVELAGSEKLGPIRHVEGSFGFHFTGDDDHRLMNPDLAGGCILDLGVYPLHTMYLMLGAPSRLVADGQVGHTGVDVHALASMHWDAGRNHGDADRNHGDVTGTAATTLIGGPMHTFEVVCENGRLVLTGDNPYRPDGLQVDIMDPADGSFTHDTETTERPGNGFTFQIAEVVRCLRAGDTESPMVPWSDSIEVADVLAQWRAGIS